MLCYCPAVGTISLSLSRVRDDLFRVELDNVVGEEMFYSKVRFYTSSNTHPHDLCAEKKRTSLLNFIPNCVAEEDVGIQQK